MNDGIQPVRYVPQVKQAGPKERNSGRKDGKKGEQKFSEYIPAADGDEKNKRHNKGDPDLRSADEGVEGKEDSPKNSNLDEDCGTIINVEA